MGELSDRLLILLIAATGLLVLLVGWELALVEALEMELSGRVEAILYVAVIVVFVLVVISVWIETERIDEDRD
ncbi:hypothetical protein HALLA_09155 [Halostagnicola larsenii XH-48]|uniref:Uncharacterized protein n=1 Tax=Halostagnicola larsenii XH-48 TaxID=797299 RepID=W0JNY8_9EURY|nr:hypothetical protein [Halostagnicola larsenii]AHF99016.1 hypothetical protein HALLA_09155 [Halostagnicola larsenii XH-48]